MVGQGQDLEGQIWREGGSQQQAEHSKSGLNQQGAPKQQNSSPAFCRELPGPEMGMESTKAS